LPTVPFLRVGYVAPADSAPLLAADELGLFARQGVRVSLSEGSAWAAVRDKLALGALDGARLLGPVPIALACGLGGVSARASVLELPHQRHAAPGLVAA
jgi:ABC-type nitrate/sulfonate/bicarbonate transport system substrate-binding protein